MMKKYRPVTLDNGCRISYSVGNGWYIVKTVQYDVYHYWRTCTRTFEFGNPTYYGSLQEAHDDFYTCPKEQLEEYVFSDSDIHKVRVNHNNNILLSIGDQELLITKSDAARLTQYFEQVGESGE